MATWRHPQPLEFVAGAGGFACPNFAVAYGLRNRIVASWFSASLIFGPRIAAHAAGRSKSSWWSTERGWVR